MILYDPVAYHEGQKSFLTDNINPHPKDSVLYKSWEAGWDQQEKIWADWINSCGGKY